MYGFLYAHLRCAVWIPRSASHHRVDAVMLVHSFSQNDAWFDKFGAFATLLRAEPRKYGFARSAQHSQPRLPSAGYRGTRST